MLGLKNAGFPNYVGETCQFSQLPSATRPLTFLKQQG
jgi:hypothetical protein